MTYRVIRSDRKTLAVELAPEGVLVRAPRGATETEIRAFLERHRRWIETHLQTLAARQAETEKLPPITPEELRGLAEQARRVIPARVAYYAPRIGVTWGRITIRSQRSKWGSCTARGNLNFNCLLMLAPPEVLDSVVVHELCHRKEMNHSDRFYALVLRAFPDYRKWDRWLRENGRFLMARMIKGAERPDA